jgi:uncharacterized protein YdaU (DUF1376 family)
VNYYERYCGDYQRDTAHLSLSEHGAYTMLLDTYFSVEKPLPEDLPSLYRVCRAMTRIEQQAVKSVAEQFFPVSKMDGLRHNRRADREIAKARPKIDAAKMNGRKGGRPYKEADGPGSAEETQPKPGGLSPGYKNTAAEITQRVSQQVTQWVTQQATQPVAQRVTRQAAQQEPSGKAHQHQHQHQLQPQPQHQSQPQQNIKTGNTQTIRPPVKLAEMRSSESSLATASGPGFIDDPMPGPLSAPLSGPASRPAFNPLSRLALDAPLSQRSALPSIPENTFSASESDSQGPPRAASTCCNTLIKYGVHGCNPHHPTLRALLHAGAAEAEFVQAAQNAVFRGKASFAYVVGTVKRQREEAAQLLLHRGRMPNSQELLEASNKAATEGWRPPELRDANGGEEGAGEPECREIQHANR